MNEKIILDNILCNFNHENINKILQEIYLISGSILLKTDNNLLQLQL